MTLAAPVRPVENSRRCRGGARRIVVLADSIDESDDKKHRVDTKSYHCHPDESSKHVADVRVLAAVEAVAAQQCVVPERDSIGRDRLAPPSGCTCRDRDRPARLRRTLHRGADTGAYLVAYSWVWDNVVEVHSYAAGQPALDCPDLDPTNFVEVARSWAGCVWEFAVLEHERSAWARHVLSPEVPDLGAYLFDTVPNGLVGL